MRAQLIPFVILLVASLLLGACAPRPVEVVEPIPTASPGAGDTPENPPATQAPEPQGKLPAGSQLANLVEKLAAAGLQVVEGGPNESALLDSLASYQLSVNGQPVFVYEFASQEAATAAARRISPDGTTLTGPDGSVSSVFWINTPHFWQSESFIVQYLGVEEAILAGMKTALGLPFASGWLEGFAESSRPTWREVRQAGTQVGFALPCSWLADEMPLEGAIRSQVARSYDAEFFALHSEKGEWVGGEWPTGAYKLDITLVDVADPSQGTVAAYAALSDSSLQQVQDLGEVRLGEHSWQLLALHSTQRPEEADFQVYVHRLAANRLLLVAAYPQPAALASPVVQAVVASFAMSSQEAVRLPALDPGPALSQASCRP